MGYPGATGWPVDLDFDAYWPETDGPEVDDLLQKIRQVRANPPHVRCQLLRFLLAITNRRQMCDAVYDALGCLDRAVEEEDIREALLDEAERMLEEEREAIFERIALDPGHYASNW